MPRKNPPEPKPLFVERMKKLLGKDFEKYQEILKIQPVKSIRCNKLKISPKELKLKLENKGWKINQPWKNYPEVMIVEGKFASANTDESKQINTKTLPKKSSSLITPKRSVMTKSDAKQINSSAKARDNLIELEPGELGRALEHLLGYYYIQELASMLPVIALKPKENEIVLDLCAAPGSKTTQIASEIKNTGTIIANEIGMGRLKILSSNLERCGVTNTIITKKDGVALCNKLAKENIEVDKILVDAPCSGEGTLRSSPKTYLMWNPKTIKTLSKLQKQLFSSAFNILKKNGELIYSTCTHAPEENEAIVDFALKESKDKIKIEKINLPINPRQGIKSFEDSEYLDDVKYSCRVYPQDNNTEGFFLAKFRRVK